MKRSLWSQRVRATFSRGGLLRRFVEAGFEERILFGSDQTVWPEALEASIEAAETKSFRSVRRTEEAHLHDNAVRFFRLDRGSFEVP